MKPNKLKYFILIAFFTVSESAWSQITSLFCQGRYETGELLQLRLDMDIENRFLLAGDVRTPISVDDFNIVWRSEANGVQFESILNRWTGELNATMIETTDIRPNFLGGICQSLDKRSF